MMMWLGDDSSQLATHDTSNEARAMWSSDETWKIVGVGVFSVAATTATSSRNSAMVVEGS